MRKQKLGLGLLRQGLDKLQDVGVSTSLFDLVLCHFRGRFDRPKKDVETYSASVESLIDRHKKTNDHIWVVLTGS